MGSPRPRPRHALKGLRHESISTGCYLEACLRRALVILTLVSGFVACSSRWGMGDRESFTLYRTSVANDSLRIHVVTFDAADGQVYNRDNCELARSLFQNQSGVRVRFFCEKGLYRK